MIRTHELRTAPDVFEPIRNGSRPYDVRYNDRGFQRSDIVILREWDGRVVCDCEDAGRHRGDCDRYTGRTMRARVGHVTPVMLRTENRNVHAVLGLLELQEVEYGVGTRDTARRKVEADVEVAPEGTTTPRDVAKSLGLVGRAHPTAAYADGGYVSRPAAADEA